MLFFSNLATFSRLFYRQFLFLLQILRVHISSAQISRTWKNAKHLVRIVP